MAAIGYIRQSRRADQDTALSYDTQAEAVRRLGGADLEVVADMGRSGGRGKEHLRVNYQRVLEQIEAGSVDTVYALNLARMARSVPELHRLMTLAKDHGVRIHTAKEGVLDPTTTTGRLTFGIFALLAEFVRDLAVDAANENVAERRRRGDRMGRLPYGEEPGESTEAVLTAFKEAGSYNGAAVLLNRRGIPTRFGRPWGGTTVHRVIKLHAPALERAVVPGVKVVGSFTFARLLVCPFEGNYLTGSRERSRKGRDVVYRCRIADTNPAHRRPYRIRESVVREWAIGEAARFRVPGDVLQLEEQDAKRAALEARRIVVDDMYEVHGPDWGPEYRRRLAAIEEAEDALEDTALRLVDIPAGVDWTWEPSALNAVLRSMWSGIQLDATMAPVAAGWHVPEWRAS